MIDSKGGAERVFCEFANNLAIRGHKVTAICCEPLSGQLGFPILEQVKFINVGYPVDWNAAIKYKIKRGLKKLINFAFFAKTRELDLAYDKLEYKSKIISETLYRSNPDIIVSFNFEATYLLKEILHINVPIITMTHMNPSSYKKFKEFQLFKSSIKSCTCLQVPLPEFINEIQNLFGCKNIVVIPNAVPQFKAASKNKFHKITNIARLSGEKRQDLAIKAFTLIMNQFPDWTLEIYGAPSNLSYLKKLEALIEAKNAKDRIILRGPTCEVEKELDNSSIFLFPSKEEGFGLALAEAMSKGLPVIGCRSCSAVNTLIKHEINGLLCEDTAEDIADKLKILIENENYRHHLGMQARKDMEQYAPKKIWDQWERLLILISGNN